MLKKRVGRESSTLFNICCHSCPILVLIVNFNYNDSNFIDCFTCDVNKKGEDIKLRFYGQNKKNRDVQIIHRIGDLLERSRVVY